MPNGKKREKNPYVAFTIEEVMRAEANGFVVQAGLDLVPFKGRFSFSEKMANQLYGKLYGSFLDILENGTAKEKKQVLNTMLNFRIMPLRIH